jgi:primosomal protein N' (replication factor Y)
MTPDARAPPSAAQVIAKVLPLTTTRAVRGLFDYRAGQAAGSLGVGSLVRIRFANRPLIGVVVAVAERSELDPGRLSEIEAVLPARLPADLVALASWMAVEYCSTAARALQVILPAGITRAALERRILLAGLTDAGRSALDDGSRLTSVQRNLLSALQAGERPCAALGTAALRRMEARGLVSIRSRPDRPRPSAYAVGSAPATAPPLNDEQREALRVVLAALARPRPSDGDPGLLLHGVTGSGKTEVYLAAAQATLAAGRSAIILVPEISLTPQALARFEARLGDVVAVLHSGLSEATRRAEWWRLASGQARVCVGARSAVFAPLPDIGLIVLDEEHESSYKHEGDPRYDARHVAERRAAVHGALLLAGSATPRAESAWRLHRLRLRERVDGRALPAVEILDMRGLHHPLHPATRLALGEVRASSGKAIVLLNRRGWSNFLSCASCGEVWMCPNCEVTLVLHRSGGIIACHHCGHSRPVPDRCPACHSASVARHGAGTERLEHELRQALRPGASFPIIRLDADAAGLEGRARALERFAAARCGVLLGTQMVAKGHDFPDVALGVVIDADQTLRFPDFRAEERTFALVTQLAGRAGRGGSGRVLVQTSAPSARPIVLAAAHDADRFLAGELDRRRALRYPPFSTLIRVVCSSPDPEAPGRAVAALRGRIELPGASVLGPAPLFTLRGRARAQLVVKADDRPGALAALAAAVESLVGSREHRGVNVAVDVDPQ